MLGFIFIIVSGAAASSAAAAGGDDADEMFFYRASDGVFRYYDMRADGRLGTLLSSGSGYSTGWSSITAVDLDGDNRDEMFFYRASDGVFRYYDMRADGSLGNLIRSGTGYSLGWSSITAVDLDGDGQDELFFYRASDGVFRYYDMRADGSLGNLIRSGTGYSLGWSSITAVDLDGDAAGPPFLFGPHIGGSGTWEVLDKKFTGAHFSPIDPSKAIAILNAARADGKSVILMLARSGSHYQNPDGTFSLEKWKAAIDQYAGVDFTPWIRDGTLLAHYLVSEPMARNSWGGEVITAPVLDEMARYSKGYWPNLTTAVREHPTDLIAHAGGKGVPLPGWEWTYLDTAWARYSADKGPIATFISEEVAAAKQQGLGLIFGMNVLDGGDGSSGIYGVNGWVMSAAELVDYGTRLVKEPYGCAVLMWHYTQGDTGYFDRPDIDAAMANLAQIARARGRFSCLVAG